MMQRPTQRIEDTPNMFKSFVWQDFGYPVEIKLQQRYRQDPNNMYCMEEKKKHLTA